MSDTTIRKIGILTMRYDNNYGGMLQCVALYNVLKNMGFDVEVIDYGPSNINSIIKKLNVNLLSISTLNKIIQRINKWILKSKKRTKKLSRAFLDNFSQFKTNNLKFTERVDESTIGPIAQKFDAIIVGSDQIWNELGCNQIIYLFDWVPDYKGIRLSYAPCSIFSTPPDIAKAKIKNCFLKFAGISVRDASTQQLVENSCGITPEIVADPTCLYDFENLIFNPMVNAPYIFTYILGSEIDGGHKAVLNTIREKYGKMKVYAVVISSVSLEAEKFADTVIYDASPQLWLSLIAHATFVYTDSYHGCLFAMKFKKPFLAYYKERSRASRLIDLQMRFEVNNTVVNSVKDMIQKKSIEVGIDYEIIDKISGKFRLESFDFLKRFLQL